MAEWHLDPVYINENWTDELLEMMIKKLSDRKQRESDTIKGRNSTSVEALSIQSGGKIRMEKG